MKKFLCILLASVLVLSLAACAGQDGGSTTTASTTTTTTTAAATTTTTTAATTTTTAATTTTEAANPADGETLESLMDTILKGVETPKTETMPVEDELWENFVFVKKPEGAEAVVSEALISAIAHSVVLVRTADADEAETLAGEIEKHADPRKWICVEADKVTVSVHDNVILLCMSKTETCDAIVKNFDALWA